jgi:predicted RNA-binding protein with PUA-like domain
MKHWLVKSEPEAYSWTTFVAEDGTAWTGVRNYQARNNLNLMQPGDLVLFYHSVSEKAVVGIAEVAALAAPDTTAEAGSPWVAVHLRPVQPGWASWPCCASRGCRCCRCGPRSLTPCWRWARNKGEP